MKDLKGPSENIIICCFSEANIWLSCFIKGPDAQVRVNLMT